MKNFLYKPLLIVLFAFFFTFFVFQKEATANGETPTPSSTPTLPPDYLQIGQIFESSELYDQATEYYLKAVIADPANTLATEALKRVMQNNLQDPRLELAQNYVQNQKYTEAVALYETILKEKPWIKEAQTGAMDAQDLASSTWQQTWEKIKELGIQALIWGGILLGVFILSKIIRAVWGAIEKGQRRKGNDFILLPFINATGDKNLEGLEQAARSLLAVWLFQAGAAVRDEKVTVELAEIPDIGFGVTKLFTWFISLIRPPKSHLQVQATLLGATQVTIDLQSVYAVGMAIYIKPSNSELVSRAQIFWLPLQGTKPEFNDFKQLAFQTASWLYSGQKVNPEIAELILQANEEAAKGLQLSDQGQRETAKSAFERAEQITMQAVTIERQPRTLKARGGLAAGGGIAISESTPSDFAEKRLELFQSYRTQLEKGG